MTGPDTSRDWQTPTEEDARDVALAVAEPQNARVFFAELDNPLWLKPLHDRGFFRRAPDPAVQPDGSVRLPIWPEGDYLVRMAPEAPDAVAEILAAFDDNGHLGAQARVLEAATAMPGLVAARLVPQLVQYLGQPGRHHLDARALTHVLANLASSGGTNEVKEVRRLASAMFKPRPAPDDAHLPGVRPEPVTGLDEYWYADVLHDAARAIEAAVGDDVLLMLCGWLKDLAVASGRDDGNDLASHVWRPSVAPHAQNSGHGIGNPLVDATRRTALRLVQTHSDRLPEIITKLERISTPIAERIAQHVLAQGVTPGIDRARELAEARLLEPRYLESTYRHEYAELARAVLPDAGRDFIDSWIQLVEADALVGDDEARRILAFFEDAQPDEVTDAEVGEWRRQRVREMLSAVHPRLPAPLDAKLAKLNDTLGPRADRPADFPSWTQMFSGPTAPIGPDELQSMTAAQLVRYLHEWQPSNNLWGPSREGLGRHLAEAVRSNPGWLDDATDRLVALHPTYIRSVLHGWELALKDARAIDWSRALLVLHHATSQPDEGDVEFRGDEDPGWRWTHQQVAALLQAGLIAAEGLRPGTEHRQAIWRCLEPITRSPHPSVEHEARYGGDNMDPLTLSLNVVRARAISATVAYLSWLAATDQIRAGSSRAEQAPEAWEVLDEHLDPGVDPSTAVRSAYGQDFPFLSYIAPEWAARNAERILGANGDDADERARRDAAWVAYLTMHSPSRSLFGMLEPIYRARITTNQTGGGTPTGAGQSPAGRTAEHVLLMYSWGLIDIDSPDGLVRAYFSSGPPQERADVLGHLGWVLFRETGPIEPETIARLQLLWDWRVAEVGESDETEELTGFGWWYRSQKFPPDWTIRRMAEVARTGHRFQMPGLLAEHLDRFAVEYPAECLDILDGLLGGPEGWEIFAVARHALAVLAAALDAGDAELVAKAEAILERLGRAGYLESKEQVDRLRRGTEPPPRPGPDVSLT